MVVKELAIASEGSVGANTSGVGEAVRDENDRRGDCDSHPQTGVQDAAAREALIARLYREHNQALIRFLMTRVNSEQEARDVAQEAYVRMLQLDSHGAISFLSGYLFKTAANIATDRLRSRAVRRRTDNQLAQEQEHWQPARPLDAILEVREELKLIEQLVDELPPKCRQAFYLHRLHDLSPPEISARLGVSKRMVHHYLVRAMAYVRARLDEIETTRKQRS